MVGIDKFNYVFRNGSDFVKLKTHNGKHFLSYRKGTFAINRVYTEAYGAKVMYTILLAVIKPKEKKCPVPTATK